MNLESYEIKASSSLMEYKFISSGKKGLIIKVVQYSPTEMPGVYNIGYGDLDVKTGAILDSVISDNGDSHKVLATVAGTVLRFFEHYHLARVFAVGATKSRTRLYQIGISNNLEEIQRQLIVYGLKSGKWVEFERNQNYEAFLVRKKQ